MISARSISRHASEMWLAFPRVSVKHLEDDQGRFG